MGETTRNLAVGTTTLIGVLGLMLMIVLFGNIQQWFARGYPLTITLPEAAGVMRGSPVLLSGIQVGHVEAVYLRRPGTGTGVVLECQIRHDVDIPVQVQASVQTELFAGTSKLALRVHDLPEEELDWLPKDGTAMIEGDVPTIATALTDELRRALDEPMQQLRTITNEFTSLSQEWTHVGANLNRLIGPAEQGNPDELDAEAVAEMEANVPRLLMRAERRLAEMESVIAGIDRYVSDEAMREDFAATVSNARQVSANLGEQVETLSRELSQSVTELRTRYIALADDLSGAIGSMQRLTDDARAGDGTLGRLLRDPRLYENLNDSAERMQSAVDELRLLIQKWEAEGMPLRIF